MLNSVYTTIFSEECSEIDIQIVAEYPGTVPDFTRAEIYSLWDSDNEPLGIFVRSGDELNYEGTELGKEEFNQVAAFISSFREGDWDL
jgi:hypothetical protein